MSQARKLRRERLALIRKIVLAVRERLGYWDTTFFTVKRDFADARRTGKIRVRKAGYGFGLVKKFLFWEVGDRRRIVEVTHLPRAFSQLLHVEMFCVPSREVMRIVERFRRDINCLFDGVTPACHPEHITEFAQTLDECVAALEPLNWEAK